MQNFIFNQNAPEVVFNFITTFLHVVGGQNFPQKQTFKFQKFEKVHDHVYVIQRPVWFITCIAFQLTSMDNFETFIKNIINVAGFLTRENIAHNMFFSRAQPIRTEGELRMEDKSRNLPQLVTAYLFPRQCLSGAKPPTNFNPAALELSGCLTAYSKVSGDMHIDIHGF